jgi:hypothetical protein
VTSASYFGTISRLAGTMTPDFGHVPFRLSRREIHGWLVLLSKERLMRVPPQAEFSAAKMSKVLLGVEAHVH